MNIQDFLQQQKIIRVITNGAPGYGNQIANVNLIARLREMGFTGMIELIYPKAVMMKMANLFGFPDIFPEFYHSNLNIVFYTYKAYIQAIAAGKVPAITLSLTGGIDAPTYASNKLQTITTEMLQDEFFDLERYQRHNQILFNYAQFLKSEMFILFSQYHFTHHDNKLVNSTIHLNNRDEAIELTGSWNKFIAPPAIDFSAASRFLQTPDGMQLKVAKPALETLMHAYDNSAIHFIPSYGYPLVNVHQPCSICNTGECGRCFPNNIVEIAAGARYAQLQGNSSNPIIMPLIYELDDWQIGEITRFISGTYSLAPNITGFKEMQAALEKINLSGSFSITKLTNPNARQKILTVKPGQILLVVTGSLPNVIFNNIYARNSSNILLQVREGASSLTKLLSTGRPHLRCGGYWEIETDMNLNKHVTKRINNIGREIFNDLSDWKNNSVPEIIGQYIIDAQNPASALSQYFKSLQQHALQPANDRIASGLRSAIEILENKQTNISAASFSLIHSSMIVNTVTNHASSTAHALTALIVATAMAPTGHHENKIEKLNNDTYQIDAITILGMATLSTATITLLYVLLRKVNLTDQYKSYKNVLNNFFYRKHKIDESSVLPKSVSKNRIQEISVISKV